MDGLGARYLSLRTFLDRRRRNLVEGAVAGDLRGISPARRGEAPARSGQTVFVRMNSCSARADRPAPRCARLLEQALSVACGDGGELGHRVSGMAGAVQRIGGGDGADQDA